MYCLRIARSKSEGHDGVAMRVGIERFKNRLHRHSDRNRIERDACKRRFDDHCIGQFDIAYRKRLERLRSCIGRRLRAIALNSPRPERTVARQSDRFKPRCVRRTGEQDTSRFPITSTDQARRIAVREQSFCNGNPVRNDSLLPLVSWRLWAAVRSISSVRKHRLLRHL